jgi:glyceraldehyde-3-phosphate dehydrogenase (NADP+)
MDKKINFGNYINGSWIEESNEKSVDILDKYSSEVLTSVTMANDDMIEESLASTTKGFIELRSWSAGKRSNFLYKLADALKAREEEAVELIIKEAGKPRLYAISEVQRCLSTIEASAVEAKRLAGEMVPIDFDQGEGKTAFTKRFPIGPVLCITPFNFPLNLVLHKVAPALASGCSVIVKPAPQAPLCALFLASLMDEVGYPDGVANFVNCSIDQAEKLVKDDRIKMISFTGSEKVGWHIKSICKTKKIALELGGNAAVVIDDISGLEMIAKKVATGAFLYAGQICISTQRILVHSNIYEKFKQILVKEIESLNVGDPKDEKTSVGPLIDHAHLKRIHQWCDEARVEGAVVLTGGEILSEKQNIFKPTLFEKAKSPLKIVDEEVFGPVAILDRFENFDQAIEMVNNSKFGLQVGVYTDSIANMKRSHDELEVAGVIMNDIPGFRIDTMPYGGIKMSGLGREGLKYAIEEMTEPRLIVF